jgi:hypothetical protein
METPSMLCHPERSMAVSEANRHMESKDLVLVGATTGKARNSLEGLDHRVRYAPLITTKLS